MYQSILVPVDLGRPESWKVALSTVLPLAECFDADITICSVVSDIESLTSGEWLPISVEQMLFDARAKLEGLAASAPGDRKWAVEVTAGSVASGILEIAERMDADLIVLVSHQPAILDYLRAANAIRVAGRAKCSVLLARKGKA
jgi:nucleotide-binding universal stress UspA family protein